MPHWYKTRGKHKNHRQLRISFSAEPCENKYTFVQKKSVESGKKRCSGRQEGHLQYLAAETAEATTPQKAGYGAIANRAAV